MATAIQSIFIQGYEERSKPKPHVVYRIDIAAHVRSWQMWRRYSEFDDLHTELTKSCGGAEPPEGLPPKHPFKSLFGRSKRDENILEERKVGLEKYLRAILSAKDEKWREAYAFKEFLGVPSGRAAMSSNSGSSISSNGDSSPLFSSSTWLDEHTELQSRLRDVWSDIHKRDALSDRGDVAAAHKANVGAKAKLAGVLSRIGHLGKSLQQLGMAGMNEGELQRRTDMVARLQDDCEKLGKLVSVARQAAQRAAAGGSPGFANSVAPDSDRQALMGGAARKPARRVFGEPPKETEETRPLDNTGLLSLQQRQVDTQDNQLAQLTTILQRQRQLGEAINEEVAQQIEMLDDLTNEVDRTASKLHHAKTQLNRLS